MYFPNVCIHVKIYTHKSLVGEILGSFNIYGQHHFMVAPMFISSTGGKGGEALMEGEPNWLGKGGRGPAEEGSVLPETSQSHEREA